MIPKLTKSFFESLQEMASNLLLGLAAKTKPKRAKRLKLLYNTPYKVTRCRYSLPILIPIESVKNVVTKQDGLGYIMNLWTRMG